MYITHIRTKSIICQQTNGKKNKHRHTQRTAVLSLTLVDGMELEAISVFLKK